MRNNLISVYLITDAAKSHINEQDAEEAIRMWLKNARDRNGGRRRREEKKGIFNCFSSMVFIIVFPLQF